MVKTWTDKKITSHEEKEYSTKLLKLLTEIVFITGSRLYDHINEKGLYNLQIQVIGKFILSSFSFFSFSEISQAFYLNSAGKFGEIHSHYGRELNIEFIGKVLSGYKTYKQSLFDNYGERLVSVINPPKELPAEIRLTDEDYLNDKRESIEQAYQRLLNDLDLNEELFPEYFYDVLVSDGAIGEGLYEKVGKEAKQRIAKSAQVDMMLKNRNDGKGGKKQNGKVIDGSQRMDNSTGIKKELEKLRGLVRAGKIEKYQPVITVSKQLIVKEYFLFCMTNGDKNIYTLKT